MKSDLELAEDLKRGDRSAFHKIFRRHHMGLLNFFHRLAGNHRTAEVLTEQVFLRVYADRAQLKAEPPFKFSTYLYRAGYIFWRGSVHSSGVSRATPPEENKSSDDEIMAAVQSLPEVLRPVVVLCELNGLSYQESALVLDLTESEVRHRMNDAYGYLRVRMSTHAAQAGLGNPGS